MNAIAAFPSPSPDHRTQDFYDTIAGERDALSHFLRRPNQPAIGAVIELIARQQKPLILIGVGKSGHIAAKLAATFSSLEIAAFFLNASEAAHGDLGAVQQGSVVLGFSNSGSTQEIMRLLPSLRDRKCTIVAVVGSKVSPLARCADHVIHAEITTEADSIGMAPTASTTLQLAIGDALAVAVSQSRGFSREDFLRHHPAGLLGQQMIPVASLMRQGDDVPKVGIEASVLEVLTVMSAKRMGAACVVDGQDRLRGLIVDGDVRRALQRGAQFSDLNAAAIMQERPQTISENALMGEVLKHRNSAAAAWLVMPVINDAARLKGMLHIQDMLG